MRLPVLTLTLVLLPALGGQGFEVASIKPSAPQAGPRGSVIAPQPNGGVKVENVSLKRMIQWAYNLQDFQLSGGPGWMASEQWNIDGRAEGPQEKAPEGHEAIVRNVEASRVRLRALMEDRFALKFHWDTRESTAYDLVIAKGGTKLVEPSQPDSAPAMMRSGSNLAKGHEGMAALIQVLSQALQRPVVDRTGLANGYDIDLHWTPDNAPEGDTGPTLFTAIQEQLGLKLETTKAPLKTMVIDALERPTEN